MPGLMRKKKYKDFMCPACQKSIDKGCPFGDNIQKEFCVFYTQSSMIKVEVINGETWFIEKTLTEMFEEGKDAAK